MRPRFYVTTPIYYANASPHIGHAYTTIVADTISRWHRLRGRDVFFLTGTDEHGQKVMRAAEARGLTPIEHCDRIADEFRALWARLDVLPDDFIRTTEPRHQEVVRGCLQRLWEAGEIYTADYAGWYSTSAERFWTEGELVDGRCPDSGGPVEWVTERNYFFRMSAWQGRLLEWLEAHPAAIQPEFRRNEVLGFLKKPINDLCISRPRARMSWGISLPFDPDYVAYVWFDALTNYLSGIGYLRDEAQFSRWWPADVHLVGKDILTFHTVYWFTMLLAQGIEPPRQVYAHGWWLVEGRKMSKSIGNVVHPDLLVDAYGADAVRYFLLKEIPLGLDGEFSHDAFLLRHNSDLANDLGNLAHRALSMTTNWLGGRVPASGPAEGTDPALAALAVTASSGFGTAMDKLQPRQAIEALWELVRAGNKYIDTEAPWTLNKQGNVDRLRTVLRNSLEVCRIAASYLTPVMPTRAALLLRRLGATEPDLSPAFDRLPEGASVEVGEPLFPRLAELPAAVQESLRLAMADGPADTAKPSKKKANKADPTPEPPVTPTDSPPATPATPEGQGAPPPAEAAPALINYDHFSQMDMRIGRVLTAARVPKADRLLVLQVDIGEAAPRTIVAGIAPYYEPDALVGQSVVVLANLEPRKLRGIVSHGMLLAAGESASILRPLVDVAPGTKVK